MTEQNTLMKSESGRSMQKESKRMILPFAQLRKQNHCQKHVHRLKDVQQILALIGDEQATLLKIDVRSGAQGCEFLFYTGHTWRREFLIEEGILIEISF